MFNQMHRDRFLERGLTAFHIPIMPDVLPGLSVYVAELMKWNERINLVGLKDEPSVVRELIYDALFLHGHVAGCTSLVDIGSGAGILSIPLKLINKAMPVYSVDKTLKKIQFQRHIQRALRLTDFFPIHSRVESLPSLNVEALVAKAVGNIADILRLGGGHIKLGGRAYLLKGKNQEPEDVEGFSLEGAIPYVLPDSTKSRKLFIYRRVG